MGASDLASLTDVKAWLGLTVTTSDAMLAGLITASSMTILGYLNRSILPATQTELRDGSLTSRLMLSEWPVISVSGLSVAGSTIAASTNPPYGAGYTLDAYSGPPPGRMQSLSLAGCLFYGGPSSVSITYRAGYQISAEAQIIPATPYQLTALGPYGSWGSDQGVTFVDGTPLVPVLASPTAGQYVVAAGVYTFAAADTGKVVLLSYGYVPAALRQACIEAVADEFKAKDRIGIQSKSLAGQETITFTSTMITARVKAMLAPFMRVVQP